MAKKKPLARAKSMRHLARLMGVTEGAVRKWVKHAEWPFGTTADWDPIEVEAWRLRTFTQTPRAPRPEVELPASAPRAMASGAGDLQRASVAYKLERTLLLRQQRLEREGKMHPVAECQQRRMEQITAVRAALLNLSRSLPPRLAGRPAEDMGRIIEEVVYAILNEFAGKEGSDD